MLTSYTTHTEELLRKIPKCRANTKKQTSGCSNNALIPESENSDSTLGQIITYPESVFKATYLEGILIRQMAHKICQKIYGPLQNSRSQKCEKKQVPYREPINIRRLFTNFGTQDDMAPRIFTPLDYAMTDHSTLHSHRY